MSEELQISFYNQRDRIGVNLLAQSDVNGSHAWASTFFFLVRVKARSAIES